MAILASFVHFLPNILHTWPHDSFQVIRLSMTLGIFQGHWTASHQISLKRCVIQQKLYRQLIGNHTLAFNWCHFWWPWSTFEDHFSLGCHFHVHFSYRWHAFASHGLPAIAELLDSSMNVWRGAVTFSTLTKTDFMHINFSCGQTQPSKFSSKPLCHRYTSKQPWTDTWKLPMVMVHNTLSYLQQALPASKIKCINVDPTCGPEFSSYQGFMQTHYSNRLAIRQSLVNRGC